MDHLIAGIEIQAEKVLALLILDVGQHGQRVAGRTNHRPHPQTLVQPAARQFKRRDQNPGLGLAQPLDPAQFPQIHIYQRFLGVIGENSLGQVHHVPTAIPRPQGHGQQLLVFERLRPQAREPLPRQFVAMDGRALAHSAGGKVVVNGLSLGWHGAFLLGQAVAKKPRECSV